MLNCILKLHKYFSSAVVYVKKVLIEEKHKEEKY